MKIIKNIEEYIESLKEVSGNPELILPKIYRHDPRSNVNDLINIRLDRTLNTSIGAFIIPTLFESDAIYFSPEDMKIIYKVYDSKDLIKEGLFENECSEYEIRLAKYFRYLIVEIDSLTLMNTTNTLDITSTDAKYLEELL